MRRMRRSTSSAKSGAIIRIYSFISRAAAATAPRPCAYPADDYIVGDNDVKLGEIDGVPVYISSSQYEVWKHTQLIIDVVPGRGGMFSLDNGREKRFLTRSRLFGGGEVCLVQPRG